MRSAVAIAALLAGCSSRPLVEVDDEGDDDTSASLGTPVDDDGVDDDGVDDDRPRPDDDDEAGDVDVDDGLDDDGDTTGQVFECTDADGPDVDVEVWPGQDPLLPDDGIVLRDFECTIGGRFETPGWVQFELDCLDESGLVVEVVIAVTFDGLVVPTDLAEGVPVQVRVYTWRDVQHYDEFPWRRADHFVIYRDGSLAFAGGSGLSFAGTSDGGADPAFFAPVMLPDVAPSGCPGPPMECHDPRRAEWMVTVGDVDFQGPPFQIVQVGGYDLHLGELSTSDSPDCGEPTFGRVGIAISR
jgi:hypothetical protein